MPEIFKYLQYFSSMNEIKWMNEHMDYCTGEYISYWIFLNIRVDEGINCSKEVYRKAMGEGLATSLEEVVADDIINWLCIRQMW